MDSVLHLGSWMFLIAGILLLALAILVLFELCCDRAARGLKSCRAVAYFWIHRKDYEAWSRREMIDLPSDLEEQDPTP